MPAQPNYNPSYTSQKTFINYYIQSFNMQYINTYITMAITCYVYFYKRSNFCTARRSMALLFLSQSCGSFRPFSTMWWRLNIVWSRCIAENSSQTKSSMGTWMGSRSLCSSLWLFLFLHLFLPANYAYLHMLFEYCLLEETSHLYFIGKK